MIIKQIHTIFGKCNSQYLILLNYSLEKIRMNNISRYNEKKKKKELYIGRTIEGLNFFSSDEKYHRAKMRDNTCTK